MGGVSHPMEEGSERCTHVKVWKKNVDDRQVRVQVHVAAISF